MNGNEATGMNTMRLTLRIKVLLITQPLITRPRPVTLPILTIMVVNVEIVAVGGSKPIFIYGDSGTIDKNNWQWRYG